LRWQENWQLYNNKRVNRQHDGVLETFVPMTNSLVNTLVASLYNNRPRFNFVPDSRDQEQNTEALTELIMDSWQKDGWDQKFTTNGVATVITGNGPVMFGWENDHLTAKVVAVRDFIVDPEATSPLDWRYAGRRYMTTLGRLKKMQIIYPESGELVPRYKNLDKVKGVSKGSTTDLTDKQLKDQLIGSPSEGSDQIEIIEIWDEDRVVSIAAQSVLIEDIENPYRARTRLNYEARRLDHEIERFSVFEQTGEDIGMFNEPIPYDGGLIPFALARDYIDGSLIYGSSDIDLIRDQQELLNDLTELYVEAILYTVYPERSIDPKYVMTIDDLNPKPGGVYPLPAGAITWNAPPQIPNHVFNERANIKSEIRETTAVDQVVKGVTSATAQTATEIKAQLGQAGQRIEMKAKNLENDFFKQVADICVKLLRLYITSPTTVRVMNDAGVKFVDVDPSVFVGNYTPMVQLDITREMEKGKKQEAYQAAYQIVISDPTNNLPEAKKAMYPKMMPELDQEQIEAIITPAQPQQPPGGAEGAQGGQVPPEMMQGAPGAEMPPGMIEQPLSEEAMAMMGGM
jgi:hypothetical protein